MWSNVRLTRVGCEAEEITADLLRGETLKAFLEGELGGVFLFG